MSGRLPPRSNRERFAARWKARAARIREDNADNNSWLELADDLASRLIEPRFSVSFLMYLISGVVLLGGVAIWLEIVRYAIEVHGFVPGKGANAPDLRGVMTAVHTFYPALAWSSTMQIVYSDKADKWLKAFALSLGSFILLLAVILMALSTTLLTAVSIGLGVVGVLIAILLWWIANAEDTNLRDVLPPNVGLGAKGGAIQPVSTLPGTTQGFDFGGQV